MGLVPFSLPTLRNCFFVHLFLFLWANFASTLSAAWFWSNMFMLLCMMYVVVDSASTSPNARAAEILSGLYLISALTDFVSFCISEPLARINFMTKFSLAMACLGFIAKLPFGVRVLHEMNVRGGQLFGLGTRSAAAFNAFSQNDRDSGSYEPVPGINESASAVPPMAPPGTATGYGNPAQ